MKLLTIIICLMIMGQGIAAPLNTLMQGPEGFSVQVTIPETEISLLDTLKVEVKATYPATYSPDWSSMRSHLLYHVGVSDAAFLLVSETIQPPNAIFELSPLVTGKQTLTFLNIPFESKEGLPRVEIISALFDVHVAPPAVAAYAEPLAAPLLSFSQTFPIDADCTSRHLLLEKPDIQSMRERVNEREIPWVGILGLIAALTLVLIPPKAVIRRITTPKASPKEEILHEIHELRGALQGKPDETFYTRLTHALGKYMEGTYHIVADTRTTEEFLKELAVRPLFSAETQAALKAFLENADRVKFGRLPVTLADAQEALECVSRLVML